MGYFQNQFGKGVDRTSPSESFAHRTETSKYNLNHPIDELTLNKNIFLFTSAER